MRRAYNQSISRLFKFKHWLQSLGYFLILIIPISGTISCKKACYGCGDVSFGNLSGVLISSKWQLVSATQYNSSGTVTSVYKGVAGDSLFFLWQPDANYNATSSDILSFIGGDSTAFGYSLKQITAPTNDGNYIVCSQPWKTGYSDTLLVRARSAYNSPYVVLKIGTPDNSFSNGYEIDSLKTNGETDR